MNTKKLRIIIVLFNILAIINIQILAQIRMTAKQMLPSVDSLAKTLAYNNYICGLSATNLDTMGTSNKWNYSYLAVDTADILNSPVFYFIAESAHVRLDHYGKFMPGVSMLDDDWMMDSDSALLVAQHFGGSLITNSYSSYIISADLGQLWTQDYSVWTITYEYNGTTSWIRFNAKNGQYFYSSNFPTSVKKSEHTDMPKKLELFQSFPNPFNPSCMISFTIPKDAFVSLRIVDVLGKEITRLISRQMHAGDYTYQWNANGVASGIYFSCLESNGLIQTKKIILVK